MRRETYGRVEYMAPTAEQIYFGECIGLALNRPLLPGWWLPDRLEDFRRNALADAVARALRP